MFPASIAGAGQTGLVSSRAMQHKAAIQAVPATLRCPRGRPVINLRQRRSQYLAPPPSADPPSSSGSQPSKDADQAENSSKTDGPVSSQAPSAKQEAGAEAIAEKAEVETPPTSLWGKMMFKLFGQAKLDRAKLASIGGSCLLSYGAVSNVNAISLVIIAWVTFGKSQGLSPLDPGCWPKYLAAYALLYASLGNLLRPARIALAISLTPFFDKIVGFFMGKFNFSKPLAFGATVFCVNVCGSFSYLFLGLFIATTVTGAPLLATTAA